MFQEFMFLIGLLLSLYGLSCVISSVVLWFTVTKEEHTEAFVIAVAEEPFVKTRIGAWLERLRNSGMAHLTKVIVVDCGLPENKQYGIQQYCNKKGIAFCKKEDLPEYFKNPSFQNKENTV